LAVLGDRIIDFQKQYAIYAPAGANIKRIEREINVSEQEFLELLHGLNMAKLKMQDAELSASIKAVDPPFFPLSPNPTKRSLLVLVAAGENIPADGDVVKGESEVDSSMISGETLPVAVAKGASARWGASLSVQGWTRAGWQLLLTDGTSVSARVLLDASGRQSRLLRPFGQKRLVTDQLACAWYLSDHNDPTADPSIYTHAVPQGWWYSARVGGGRRLVAFHSDADLPALKHILHGGVLVAARK
jgi:hypothetical protein